MLRWTLPLVCGALLVTIDLVIARVTQLRLLSRGSVAPYTVRAATDAVFDLRATYAEEAKAARRAYVPIYDKDNSVLYDERSTIIVAAVKHPWRWPAAITGADGGGGASDGAADAEPLGPSVPDRGLGDARGDGVDGEPDGGDGAARDASAPPAADGGTPMVVDSRLLAERQRELDALLSGCFRLLEPFYKRGVVADREFPSQKKQIRIFSVVPGHAAPTDGNVVVAAPRHVLRDVSRLHRFSELRPALEKAVRQFFFKTDPALREQVVDFILDRLPPNLTYARENKRVIDISEVTGVKVVLIRRGEILARRGQIVSSRAYHAIRAGVAAADRVSPWQRAAAELTLLVALLLLFLVTAREIAAETLWRRLRPQLLLYGGLLLLGGLGALTLAFFPVHASLIPQAALVMIFGVVLGRGPALIVAVVVPAALAVFHAFDLASLGVGVAGGFAAALVVRRRRRSGVLAAAVLVGVIQGLALEALRAAAGRPQTSTELFAAAQGFGGGLLAGLVAVVALPFIQRWFGVASQGKLMVLADFEHPLARRLRERCPEVFAHTVRVVSLADRAANAVGADRLLTRCAALYHDLGWLKVSPSEADGDQAAREVGHLAGGLELATEEGIPEEVRRLTAEHHGTLPVDAAAGGGEGAGDGVVRHRGPKPRSVESAVLMIADRLERASSAERKNGRVHDAAQVVEDVLQGLIREAQLDQCPLTHAELGRIRDALVAYLEE